MIDYDYPVVLVEWADAQSHGDSSWQDPQEILEWAHEPCPLMRTVGFLVAETSQHYVLMETFGAHECSGATKIPKGWTTKKVVLTSGVEAPLSPSSELPE